MNVLDENIRDTQADYLRKIGLACRKIGSDLAARGTSDSDIIPLLLELKRPTFFTHDSDFWDARLCHSGYCLAYLEIKPRDAAGYIRRFLRHASFDTAGARMGKVVHIQTSGIAYYVAGSRKTHVARWSSR